MTKIGDQDGIKAATNRLRDLDPAGTKLVKGANGWPDLSTLGPDVSKYGAWDKLQRTLQILKADHDAGGGVPDPSPPQTAANPDALRVVFCAEDPGQALASPASYCIALSADMAYRYPNNDRPDLDLHKIIADAKKAGHRVAGWCDCRPSGGTPAQAGVDFVRDYGLDYFIGQAESQAEMENALSVGAKVVVGNITAAGVAPLITAAVAFIQEDYWNEGWARAEDPRIAAYCAGVYPTGLWPEPGAKVTNYRQAGRWREGDGLYYARHDTDWQNLP